MLQRKGKHKSKPAANPSGEASANLGTDSENEGSSSSGAYVKPARSRAHQKTGKANLADGEGGKALAANEMQSLLVDQLETHGGLTVAVYIGDESGGSVKKKDKELSGDKMSDWFNDGKGGEFRKKAYEFAIAHGAIGVSKDNSLRAKMAMEMTQEMPQQLARITAAAEALLRPAGWTRPVRVSTLAVFTHGIEKGILLDVDEKEYAEHQFSNRVVKWMHSDEQYAWVSQVSRYLSDNPTIALYACRAAGDLESAAISKVYGAWRDKYAAAKKARDHAKKAGNSKKEESAAAEMASLRPQRPKRTGDFDEFAGWSRSAEEMGGGVPIAGLMRGGFEQALIRREIARARGVSLESLDAAWEKAVAQAGRDVAAEKHGRLKDYERFARVDQRAKEIFAAQTPGYDEAFRHRGEVRVVSHSDAGHTVANSRIAEFTSEPDDQASALGVRSSFLHTLLAFIVFEASDIAGTELSPERWHETLKDLGNKVITKANGDDELAAVREIPFIGVDAAAWMLARPDRPVMADIEDLDVDPKTTAMVLRGLRTFHRKVREIIVEWGEPAPAPSHAS
jgi:hypothetical protein